MRRRKADEGVDFEALRHAIEHCNVDVMLGFYAEDARLSILNARAQRSIPFELRGKPEIAKHFALWRRGERGCDRVGGDALVEANFAYNVADWKPDVSYEVEDDTGKLSVEQGSGQGVRLGGEARNEWVLRFNDEVPTDLQVEMGAGESNLDLDSLTLTGLDLKIGADQTMVDLTGDYQQDLDASIQGGVGEATVMLPSEIGVRVRAEGGIGKINAEGLDKEGDSYVNDTCDNSEVTVNVEVRGGVGEINLEVI